MAKAAKSNDEVLLEKIINDQKKHSAPEMTGSEYYEIFVAEQILKFHDLSYDEIEAGIVGDGGDGGIDSIFLLINGELIGEDIDDYSKWKKNVTLELFIIQAKTSSSFQETTINNFISSAQDLFTLDNDLNSKEIRDKYNAQLLEIVERFRSAYTELGPKFPTIKFNYVYASNGNEVHVNVKSQVQKLEKAIKTLFKQAEFSFQFIGAPELLDIARRQPVQTHELKTKSTPMTVDDNSYVAICQLSDFYSFILDETGKLKRAIFEANVRDYQGDVSVNKQIRESLSHSTDEDFWWLNNGITILASQVTQKGSKALLIEEPEIVNGLQTSNEIYKHFSLLKKKAHTGDVRGVLIRVIVPETENSRDRIIKATNSQTSIPPSSLRSTDRVHRNIEDFLKDKGLFYDRRKNHYKNQQKPRSKIISIQQMAQALMAVFLGRPDAARARPSTLLSKDDEYQKIFNENHPLELYFSAIGIMEKVDAFLKEEKIDARSRTNLRFYVAYGAVCEASSNASPNSSDIISAPDKINSEMLGTILGYVDKEYIKLGANDQVAKGPTLLQALQEKYQKKFSKKKKSAA